MPYYPYIVVTTERSQQPVCEDPHSYHAERNPSRLDGVNLFFYLDVNKTRPYTKRQRHPDRHANFYPLSVDSPEAKLCSRKASSREPWGYSGPSTGSSHVAKRRLRLQKSCSHFVASLGANREPTGRVAPGMKWLYQCIVRTCIITQVDRAKQGKARQGEAAWTRPMRRSVLHFLASAGFITQKRPEIRASLHLGTETAQISQLPSALLCKTHTRHIRLWQAFLVFSKTVASNRNLPITWTLQITTWLCVRLLHAILCCHAQEGNAHLNFAQSTMTTLTSWGRPPHAFKQKWKKELSWLTFCIS